MKLPQNGENLVKKIAQGIRPNRPKFW